jgi:hypothetical protein
MPKIQTKAVMIEKLQMERRRLEQDLESLTADQYVQAGVVGEWSVKDVLAHLADWETHMPKWLEAARRGEPVAEIEPGLDWKSFDAFNRRIYERHCHQTLEEVLDYFHSVHEQFMQMVTSMPEDEMLALGRYAFIGKGAVYDWLNSYANHDRWAKNKIRKWKTSLGIK